MSNRTIVAIDNKKNVRQSHGESSIQYRIAKSEVKKLVKKDKINNLNEELDSFSNLPSDKQFFSSYEKAQN